MFTGLILFALIGLVLVVVGRNQGKRRGHTGDAGDGYTPLTYSDSSGGGSDSFDCGDSGGGGDSGGCDGGGGDGGGGGD